MAAAMNFATAMPRFAAKAMTSVRLLAVAALIGSAATANHARAQRRLIAGPDRLAVGPQQIPRAPGVADTLPGGLSGPLVAIVIIERPAGVAGLGSAVSGNCSELAGIE